MHEEAHQASSRRLLGRDFAEVHAYLDRYYWEFGIGHRCVLHHRRGIEKIVERFGEDAREPAELHILEDQQLAEKIDENWRDLRHLIPASWKDYGEPVLLHLEQYDLLAAELDKLYG